jgi:hypothetical protein
LGKSSGLDEVKQPLVDVWGSIQQSTNDKAIDECHISNSAKQEDIATKIIQGELLALVNFFHYRGSVDALKKVVSTFYPASDIFESKTMLLSVFLSCIPSDCPFKAKRVKSVTRTAQEAELEDIIGIFNLLDGGQSALDGVTFSAVTLDTLPGVYGPEDVNVCAIVDRQNRSDAVVANLVESVQLFTVNGTDGGNCTEWRH